MHLQHLLPFPNLCLTREPESEWSAHGARIWCLALGRPVQVWCSAWADLVQVGLPRPRLFSSVGVLQPNHHPLVTTATHRPAHIYAWAGHRPLLGTHFKQGGNEIKFLNILCFLNLIQGVFFLTGSALKVLSVGDSEIPTGERESSS